MNNDKIKQIYKEWQEASSEIIEISKSMSEAAERQREVDPIYKSRLKNALAAKEIEANK